MERSPIYLFIGSVFHDPFGRIMPLIIGNVWIPAYIMLNLEASCRDHQVEHGAWQTIAAPIGCIAILLTPITSSEMVNFTDFIPFGWILAVVGSTSSTV